MTRSGVTDDAALIRKALTARPLHYQQIRLDADAALDRLAASAEQAERAQRAWAAETARAHELGTALLAAQQERDDAKRDWQAFVDFEEWVARAERAEQTNTRLRHLQSVARTMLAELLAASEDWPETTELMVARADLKTAIDLLADTEQETA